MTSNIWGDFFGNEVAARGEQLYEIYKKYDPDIIGIQEATGSWYLSDMFYELEKDGYLFLGTQFVHPELYTPDPGQPLHETGIYLPLLVKKDKFAVHSYGWEHFENTPDISKSVTWAVLETKQEHKKFCICNTHFWWMERNKDDDFLRAENAGQLSELMKYLDEKYQCPVFAVGDMNSRIDSEAFCVFKENGVQDLLEVAQKASRVCSWHGNPVCGEDKKYHGIRTTEDYTRSIDHMVGYGTGYYVENYYIVEDQNALDATDHSPVYADVRLL